MKTPAIHISHLGEYGLLFQSDGPLDVGIQGRYWALDLQCQEIKGIEELILGMHSLLLCLSIQADQESIRHRVLQLWQSLTPIQPSESIVNIPVLYQGQDLADIAARKQMSPEEIIRRHTSVEYTVFALGSQPGFPYLGGLDEQLAVPRRAVPRLCIEAGSVVIGGSQTGVISRASPSGWHIIGHTETKLFDLSRDRANLLSPGDRVRFSAVQVRK